MGPDNPTMSEDNALGSTMSTVTQTATPIVKIEQVKASFTKMKDWLDNTNWVVWRELIRCIFTVCGAEPYVYRQIKCPDLAVDCQMAEIWHMNDMYAQVLIVSNISKGQMVHVVRATVGSEVEASRK